MKKALLYSTILLTALFTGCKKDEPVDDTDKVPVSFVVEEEVTRTIVDNGTTRFVAGDNIGISSSGLAEEMGNAPFTVASGQSGLYLTGGTFFYRRQTPATFYAHYPATATYNNGTVKMTVSGNQTTATKFNENDFMTAIGTGNPKSVADGGTAGAVNLKFNHGLALVKVVWNGSTTAYGVDLLDVQPEVTWNYADNSLATSGTPIDISAWRTTERGEEYWALIPAQTVEAYTAFITVKDIGKNYTYTTQSRITFSTGTIKVVTLTLNPDDSITADISDLSIENWGTSDDAAGTVDKNTFAAVTLIDTRDFYDVTLNERQNKDAVMPGEWAKIVNTVKDVETGNDVIQGDVKTVRDENTNETVLAIHAATGSNWYNRCAIWRPSEALAERITPTVFKISMDVKVTDANDAIMVQVMKGDESSNKFFAIYTADPTLTYDEGRAPSPALTSYARVGRANEYVTMNFWVDFAFIISKADANSAPVMVPSTSADFSKVLFVISSHSLGQRSVGKDGAGVDIMQNIYEYFKNIKFKEQRN